MFSEKKILGELTTKKFAITFTQLTDVKPADQDHWNRSA